MAISANLGRDTDHNSTKLVCDHPLGETHFPTLSHSNCPDIPARKEARFGWKLLKSRQDHIAFVPQTVLLCLTDPSSQCPHRHAPQASSQKNKMKALGVCVLQPCSSAGRTFVASRSYLNYYRPIDSFAQKANSMNHFVSSIPLRICGSNDT